MIHLKTTIISTKKVYLKGLHNNKRKILKMHLQNCARGVSNKLFIEA